MRVELDVGHPLVLPPGTGDKALLDELVAADMGTRIDVDPHVHRRHADAFYVLEGEFAFRLRGEELVLPAGSFAFAPPGLVHNFVSSDARVLNLHAPGRDWKRTRVARREGRRGMPEEIDQWEPPPDGGLPRSDGIVLGPGEGELVEAPGLRLRVLAARRELCAFESEVAGGFAGPPLHLHRRHLDAFYVLEGALEFDLDGERVRAPAGSWAAAPPGTPHTFRNPDEAPARFLNLHAPGVRFDEYIRRQLAGESGRAFREEFDVFDPEDG